MQPNYRFALICSLPLIMSLAACGSVLKRDDPSIAHIHIGHAITAWAPAPRKQGLLVVADLSSVSAAANSELLLQATREGNMEKSRQFLKAVINDVDPTIADPELENAYGLRRAAAEAMTHLGLASEMYDASANVQRTVTRTNVKGTSIINRADELTAFRESGLAADNIGTYGLYNLREDIEAMVDREDPPYQTVESWFLFNLVKLPDGKWGFASRNSRGAAGAGY